jgi:phenylacetate-CoA ligase
VSRDASDPILAASRPELLALQLERLRWTLNHAYENSPHYRQRFDELNLRPEECRSLADLSRFPFTTKADLRARSSRLLGNHRQAHRRGLYPR